MNKITVKTTIRAGWTARVALAAALSGLSAGVAQANDYVWNSISGGLWSDLSVSGWNTNGYPSAVADQATVRPNNTSAQTLTIDVTNAVVGSLIIGDATGSSTWTLTTDDYANHKLTFDVSSGEASLSGQGGINTITTPMVLMDPITVTNSSFLYLAGSISEDVAGMGLTKTGSGILYIGGGTDYATNTYTGLTIITAGSVSINKAKDFVPVFAGDILISGGQLSYGNRGDIADTANITINGGSFRILDRTEVVNSLTVNSGWISVNGSGTSANFKTVNLGGTGSTTLAGGSWIVANRGSSWVTDLMTISGGTNTLSPSNNGNAFLTINQGITINQPSSGAFSALVLTNSGVAYRAIVDLKGDLTFNGNASNTNPTIIVATGLDANFARTGTAFRVTGNRVFTINHGAGDTDLIIEPQISNGSSSGGIIKTGTGVLQLGLGNGLSDYTGPTILSNGTLRVSGASTNQGDYVVTPNGTLAGDGLIGLASGKTVTVNGSLAPGNPDETATLTVTGAGSNAVTFGNDGELAISLTDTTNDKLAINGSLDLSGTLDKVTVTGTGPKGVAHVIVTYTGTLTGTFDEVSDGYKLIYGSGEIALMTVEKVTLISIR